MGNDWFSCGFDKPRAIIDNRNNGVFNFGNNVDSRFFVIIDEQGVCQPRHIIFLDDFTWQISMDGNPVNVVPFCREEHGVQVGDDFKNQFFMTCVKLFGGCKACEKSFKAQFLGAMTVLDVTPYKNDKGEMAVTPRKKLVLGTARALSALEIKKNNKGNLQGWRYIASRTDKMAARIGNDFEPVEHYDDLKSKYPKINLDPYGFDAKAAFEFYKNIFKPMSPEDQDRLLSQQVSDAYTFKKDGKDGKKPQRTNMSSHLASSSSQNDSEGDGETVSY